MKILLTPYNWFHQPVAGGEIYLHRLCKHLREQGHEIKAIVGHNEYYEHYGIECYPQGEGLQMFSKNRERVQWCDVILSQLIGTSLGYNLSNAYKKPLIWIAHNNSIGYAVKHGESCNVIYNSYQLRDDLHNTFGHFNTTVLHPIPTHYERTTSGKYITLINLNYNKGGHILIELAKRLPQYQFLGVEGGYSDQIEEPLPNITYLHNGTDMAQVYADTKLLIVPSEFESFSQSAMEAMQCGIPVLANPTPGLLENLSSAGIFISRNDVDKYVQTIVYLLTNDDMYKKQSDIMFDRGLCITEKSNEELLSFNNWLNKIK